MKTLGLVLELNPPHYGHQYFINQAKQIANCDYTIACMSTSFCMRGIPSCIDKWEKAKIALKLGVDYVFELPSYNYLQSADYFCRGAIDILAKLQITDIAFGVELDNLDKLQKIVDILDSLAFNADLKANLSKGSSYSASALKALLNQTNDKEIIDNYALPNNTLAIGYLKALRKYPSINIHLIKRIDNNYFDQELSLTNISSATSIRKAICEKKDYLSNVVNKEYAYLNERKLEDNLFMLLKYRFALQPLDYFKNIIGVNEGIEVRINKFLKTSNNYNELVNNIQTKRYSLNHIKRMLVNIVLDNKRVKEETYLRLLAFNKQKKQYLKKLDKETKTLIFSSPTEVSSSYLEYELKASLVYDLIANLNTFALEYKAPIIIDSEEEND